MASEGVEQRCALSGAARRQASDLQERRTGRHIQYSDKLVPGSWLMV